MTNITFVQKDLTLVQSAREAAEAVPQDADIYAFTTGIIAPAVRKETADGIEMDMAVSTISRLAFIERIKPNLKPEAALCVGDAGQHGCGQRRAPG